MSTNLSRIVGAGAFCLVIFLFGFWLSRSGKPYNGILFNVHKLVALAAVILFAVTLYRANQVTTLNAVTLVAGIATGLFFVGLFATGALASLDKPVPTLVLRLHHALPYLAALSTAATFYLLHIRQ